MLDSMAQRGDALRLRALGANVRFRLWRAFSLVLTYRCQVRIHAHLIKKDIGVCSGWFDFMEGLPIFYWLDRCVFNQII
jgi:hypothetical protein